MKRVELYQKVRHAVLVKKMSRRCAARYFGIDRKTVDQILSGDRTVHTKQHHTVVRIFERLRDERGFTGGETIVREYVALQKRRTREVFPSTLRSASPPFPRPLLALPKCSAGRCRAICSQAGRQESRRLCGTPRGQGRKPAAPGSLGRVRARRSTDRSGSCIPTCWSSGPRTRREAHLGRWSRCASPKDRAHHSPWHRALL